MSANRLASVWAITGVALYALGAVLSPALAAPSASAGEPSASAGALSASVAAQGGKVANVSNSSSPQGADDAPPPDSPPPSSNPRDFDGYYRPDYLAPLVKSAVGTSGAVQTADHKIPPFTPKASEHFNYRLSMEQRGTPVMDPPKASIPSVGLVGFLSPLLVISNPRQMLIIFESGATTLWRIRLDRAHPGSLPLSPGGDSVGHWEGNTLVVDTRGFIDSGHLDLVGTPFSKDLHMICRISKINGGRQLEFLITFDDPTNFTQPFTTRYTATWRSDERLLENEIDPPPPPAGAK